jgi:hypothetical protein
MARRDVSRQVSLMQAGLDDQLRGFLAGPFSIQVGENIDPVDLCMVPLKNPICFLAQTSCKDRR